MSTVQEALDRISGKKIENTNGKKPKLSTCCNEKLMKRSIGKGYCCSKCGFVSASGKWEQTQIDMK